MELEGVGKGPQVGEEGLVVDIGGEGWGAEVGYREEQAPVSRGRGGEGAEKGVAKGVGQAVSGVKNRNRSWVTKREMGA